MKKTFLAPALCAALLAGVLTGCGSNQTAESASGTTVAQTQKDTTDYSKVASSADMTTVEQVGEDGMEAISGKQVKDGTYSVTVDCSSKMFHVTDCQLTVKDGEMTAVMTMSGTGYRCIYLGTGEQASKAKPEDYIFPETDKDGADTFTIPVEALDQGISCAAFSKNKQQWYDRTILLRSDSLPEGAVTGGSSKTLADLGLQDGTYTVNVTLAGGSGRASIQSPTELTVADGVATAEIIWSSSNYDYMMVGATKYEPIEGTETSVFEIPVTKFGTKMAVQADTTAMSQPYLIDYTLTFDADSIEAK